MEILKIVLGIPSTNLMENIIACKKNKSAGNTQFEYFNIVAIAIL